MKGLLPCTKIELKNRIDHLKHYMIDTGMRLGLDNNKTIQISQELDTLIFEYQRMTR
jgi:hypothetical protein